MAWSGVLMRLPEVSSLTELPKDWTTPAIGTIAEVRSRLEQAFPDQRHMDGQTCIEDEEFWIEFNYRLARHGSTVESIGVRSNAGPGAMAAMKHACDVLGLRMVDCQSGEVADLSEQTESSMQEFTAWRDRVRRGFSGDTDGESSD